MMVPVIDEGASLLPLTAEMIHEALGRMTPEARRDPAAVAQYVYSGIVSYFLGKKWFEDYALPSGNKKSYLYPDFSIPGGNKTYHIRLFFLADLLFNLQNVEGLSACLRPMVKGNIEATMAELAIGMMLRQLGYFFKFVRPTQTTGADYDLALTYPDGRTACADVKCKVIGTDRTAKTIAKSLAKARTQLPKDQPGIAFVKVPQEWLDPYRQDVLFTMEMLGAVQEFFRSSERMVLVVFYVFYLEATEEFVRNRHAILEIVNEGHGFDRSAEWRLFAGDEFRDSFIDRNWHSVLKFITPGA